LQLTAEERRVFLRTAGLVEREAPGGSIVYHVAQRHILVDLELSDILTTASTCRLWRSFAGDESLYEDIVHRDYDVIRDGGCAADMPICWRHVAIAAAKHEARLLMELDRLAPAIANASTGVRPFLATICGLAAPDESGVFTMHAPQATPIHYRRKENADGWCWSADNIHWEDAGVLRPTRGHFADATLADINAEISLFLETHNPRTSPLFQTTRFRLRGRAPFTRGGVCALEAARANELFGLSIRNEAVGAFYAHRYSGLMVHHVVGSSPIRVLCVPERVPKMLWAADGDVFRTVDDKHDATGAAADFLSIISDCARPNHVHGGSRR
jgi:hypothetical protein